MASAIMDDPDFICPQSWLWSSIYQKLHTAWEAKNTELQQDYRTDHAPDAPAETAETSSSGFDFTDEEGETVVDASAFAGIPEPPHMIPPPGSDMAFKNRWEETVEWAKTYGFIHLIPELHEDDCYFRA